MNRYFVYLIGVLLCILFWLFSLDDLSSPVAVFYGSYLFFLITVLAQILAGKLFDLSLRDFRKISWERIGLSLAGSLVISLIIVNDNVLRWENINTVLNTAGVGVIIGYAINKFDTRLQEGDMGRQMLQALFSEVTDCCYKIECMRKGYEPTPVATFVWDNVKLSKHYRLIWTNSELTKEIFILYQLINGVNWRVNVVNFALFNVMQNNSATSQQVYSNSAKLLQEALDKVIPVAKGVEEKLRKHIDG